MTETAKTVHDLVSSLRGIAKFVRAFAEAEAIANTLLAAEQRSKDLASQVNRAEARLAELQRQTAAVEADITAGKADARKVVAEAKSKAGELLAKAQAAHDEQLRKADETKAAAQAHVDEAHRVAQAQIVGANARVAERTAELDTIESKLAAAREALQNLLKA